MRRALAVFSLVVSLSCAPLFAGVERTGRGILSRHYKIDTTLEMQRFDGTHAGASEGKLDRRVLAQTCPMALLGSVVALRVVGWSFLKQYLFGVDPWSAIGDIGTHLPTDPIAITAAVPTVITSALNRGTTRLYFKSERGSVSGKVKFLPTPALRNLLKLLSKNGMRTLYVRDGVDYVPVRLRIMVDQNLLVSDLKVVVRPVNHPADSPESGLEEWSLTKVRVSSSRREL